MRIAQVSNENFYKINKQNKFYEYMITEPHHIFQGFQPSGFDNFEEESNSDLNYQIKVTQKQYNEMNNKLKEIKKLQERLKIANTKEDELKQMWKFVQFSANTSQRCTDGKEDRLSAYTTPLKDP